MTLGALLTLAALQALIAMSPGPAAILTVRTAATGGARAGLALSLGLALAILVWAGAALAGLSLLFELAPYLQTALRVAGGLFLIHVALGLWRNAARPVEGASAPAVGPHAALVRLGLWTNLANPKALAYFAAVFTGVMPAEPTALDAAVILCVVCAVEMGWYAALSALFSRAPAARAYGRLKSRLDRAFGATIGALGARIAIG